NACLAVGAKNIVKSISHVVGRKVKLSLAALGGGIKPALFVLRRAGRFQPHCMPAIRISDLRRDSPDVRDASRRMLVYERPIEIVVHAKSGRKMQVRRHS